ncbi:PorT family protein [Rhodocytophaga rosea]|uniref:PorT family protein n=1 Tax=Rhodocytophaga rosea TaxID=2704465 RepID=A0A6C0GMX4_9BACT|nr:porin family protein [Rhodocytophaga rosea]QHT69369.1 PorT family protein [Rhodocytophaga rosea]
MNKIYLLYILFMLLCTKAEAQISLVPRVGLTFSTVAFENNIWEDRKIVTGFTAGVGVNYSLTGDNFLSIQPEIIYTQKGFAAKGSFLTVDYDGTYRLNYLELPLLLKLSFGNETIHAYVNAGPSVGYLLNGRVRGSSNLLGTTASIDEPIEFTETPNTLDITELDANRIEVSANAGIGIGYLISEKATLFLDIRYSLGVTDFDQTQASKNRVIALSAGLQIPF